MTPSSWSMLIVEGSNVAVMAGDEVEGRRRREVYLRWLCNDRILPFAVTWASPLPF